MAICLTNPRLGNLARRFVLGDIFILMQTLDYLAVPPIVPSRLDETRVQCTYRCDNHFWSLHVSW